MRIALLSDLHAGSHAGDVARLDAIVTEAASFKPDLVLHGGDFVNMQPFGGGRLAPHVIAAILARLDAPLGRFAVLGNHDYLYGADEITQELRDRGITVLSDDSGPCVTKATPSNSSACPTRANCARPGARFWRARPAPGDRAGARSVLVRACAGGPHLTLAGHTHGGQIRLPLLGAFTNASRAPLRWSLGHVLEEGRHLYVTSGIGTSGIPLRIGAPPEFAVIDVTAA